MKYCPYSIAFAVSAYIGLATSVYADKPASVEGVPTPPAEVAEEDEVIVLDDAAVIQAQTSIASMTEKAQEDGASETSTQLSPSDTPIASNVTTNSHSAIEAETVVEIPTDENMRVIKESNGLDAQRQTFVSLTFEDTSVNDIIKAFRDVTRANIISTSALTNLTRRVSVKLDKVPWRSGLSSILDTCDLVLTETPIGSQIYTITPKQIVVPKVSRNFILTHASVTEVAKVLNMHHKPEIATPFPSANVVVVNATEAEIEECERIIKAVDKPVPQVYIEARFVELSAAASKELGMRWDSLGGKGLGLSSSNVSAGYDWNKTGGVGNKSTTRVLIGDTTVADNTQTTSAGGALNAIGTSTVRNFGGVIAASDFGLYWNSFEQEDGTTTFSNPKIIVANEREALVDMTTKEPCVDVSISRSGDNNDQLDIATKLTSIPGKKDSEDIAFFAYGISLSVTPRVSSDGLITVDIVPSISDKTGTYAPAGSGTEGAIYSQYPIIYMQKLQTRFTMKDGSTAVIGGLSRSYEKNIDSGIPLLRSIPWAGERFFGWKSRQKEQREIVIFVTVGVANPYQVPEDLGMPKNAVLAQQVLNGESKEPGDQPAATLLQLKD